MQSNFRFGIDVDMTKTGNMMSDVRKTSFPAIAMTLGLAFSPGASAQSTWNVYNGSSSGSGCTQNATNTGSYNNSWGCTSVTGGTAGTAMTASAWSTDRTNTGTPAKFADRHRLRQRLHVVAGQQRFWCGQPGRRLGSHQS